MKCWTRFDRLDIERFTGDEIGQRAIFVLTRDRGQHTRKAIESQDPAANAGFEIARPARSPLCSCTRPAASGRRRTDARSSRTGVPRRSPCRRAPSVRCPRSTAGWPRALPAQRLCSRRRWVARADICAPNCLPMYSRTDADRIARQIRGVGAHVGDVARLVETLRHHHGLLHAERQPRTRCLLQRRGDERCARARGGRLVFARHDGERLSAQALHCVVGLSRVDGAIVLATILERPESGSFIVAGTLRDPRTPPSTPQG